MTDQKRDESRDLAYMIAAHKTVPWSHIGRESSVWERFVPHSDLVAAEAKLDVSNDRAELLERANFCLHSKASRMQARIRQLESAMLDAMDKDRVESVCILRRALDNG